MTSSFSPAHAAVVFQELRRGQRRDGAVPIVKRLALLKALRRAVIADADALCEAVAADFGGRSRTETVVSEIAVTLGSIDYALSHLARWTKPQRVAVGWRFWPASARVLKQPLGVVGIIAPWNYPIQLSLVPLVGALAAGCHVILKPSEHVPRTAALLADMLGKTMDPAVVQTVQGGAGEAAALSALPLDKLLFTGSTQTGRLVARSAAENLTPVLLELGGKSPAIIDPSADIAKAAADIVAGKLLNAGQTCVAPDYVFVPRGRIDAFVAAARQAAATFYPAGPGEVTAICRPGDQVRLAKLIAGQDTIPLLDGVGTASRLQPVLVIEPPRDGDLMREEIFGPILPVLGYETKDEIYQHLAGHPDPLALYWFGSNLASRDEVLRRTRSGGVSINDTLMHVAVEALPFGGLGASGMGAYHGEAGFEAFTHRRAVFTQHRWSLTRLLRPPYGKLAERITRGMVR